MIIMVMVMRVIIKMTVMIMMMFDNCRRCTMIIMVMVTQTLTQDDLGMQLSVQQPPPH